MLRWHFSMWYTLVCIAEISGNSSKTESNAKSNNDWYGNEPTVWYRYSSRFGRPSVLNPDWYNIGNKSHMSWCNRGFGWLQSQWLLSWKSTSPHLSVICCSDGSKSLTVNSIADRTDCGTLGVGDKVSCLPFRSGVVCGIVGGTARSPVSSSSVRRSSGTGTATFVLGLSGEFGGTLCGGFIGSLISSPSWGCITSMLEVSNELSVALPSVPLFVSSESETCWMLFCGLYLWFQWLLSWRWIVDTIIVG